MEFKRAAVIGTGMMGPGIAASLAIGGLEATIVSRNKEGAEKGLAAARWGLGVLEEAGLLGPDEMGPALGRLSASDSLEEAAAGADLVIESAPERMDLKRELFSLLDRVTRAEAVLASNTSGLSITAIAEGCRHKARVLTMHYWNPPHLMPLVEIVLGEESSRELVEPLKALLRACGKAPVVVKKDRPGQLGNRLQMALFREAVHIVAEGIADAEDVDRAASLGFGLRLPAYGILEHIDMVGLELARAVCDYAAQDLNSERRAPALFDEKIARGEKGAATGKGFYDWQERCASDVKKRRDEFVIDCLKKGITRQRG